LPTVDGSAQMETLVLRKARVAAIIIALCPAISYAGDIGLAPCAQVIDSPGHLALMKSFVDGYQLGIISHSPWLTISAYKQINFINEFLWLRNFCVQHPKETLAFAVGSWELKFLDPLIQHYYATVVPSPTSGSSAPEKSPVSARCLNSYHLSDCTVRERALLHYFFGTPKDQ
jgi:hypothetical protein